MKVSPSLVSFPTVKQITQMMEMQDQLNQRLHPEWKAQNWRFDIALLDECMEILGHLNWKWWKDTASYKCGVTTDNLRQLQLELVDVWHFSLSSLCVSATKAGMTYQEMAEAASEKLSKAEVRTREILAEGAEFDIDPQACVLEMVNRLTHSEQSGVDTPALLLLHCAFDMTAANLFQTYCGKYALNKLRWDNGYAEGSYMKHWLVPSVSIMSHEDNWFLEYLMQYGPDTCKVEEEVEFYFRNLDLLYKEATGGK